MKTVLVYKVRNAESQVRYIVTLQTEQEGHLIDANLSDGEKAVEACELSSLLGGEVVIV